MEQRMNRWQGRNPRDPNWPGTENSTVGHLRGARRSQRRGQCPKWEGTWEAEMILVWSHPGRMAGWGQAKDCPWGLRHCWQEGSCHPNSLSS